MKQRKIKDWTYNVERGTWELEYDYIKAFVSFWRHHELKHAHIIVLRWEHQNQSYATYLKLSQPRQNTKNMLIYVGKFLANWIKENDGKEADSTDLSQQNKGYAEECDHLKRDES